MKNLILLFAFVFSFGFANAQIEYPRLETDSLGQQIVVMTIKQAQSLDNNTDLLLMFEKLDSKLIDYDSLCLKVVNDKDIVIASQTVQISNLKNSVLVKDEKIRELQSKVADLELKIVKFQAEIDNKNKEIKLHKDQITSAKWKFGAGGGIIGVLVGVVIGILATH